MKNPSHWKPMFYIGLYHVWYRKGFGKFTYTTPSDNGLIGRNPFYNDFNEIMTVIPKFISLTNN